MKHPSPLQLTAFLDGEVDAHAARATAAHLAACPACRRAVSQMRQLRQAIQATRPLPPEWQRPRGFVLGLKRRIAAPKPSMWGGVLYVSPILLLMGAVAAKLAVLAVVGDHLVQRMGLVNGGPTRVANWVTRAATGPLIGRMVGEPLGWSQEQISTVVTDAATRAQDSSLVSLLPGLIMIIPMAFFFSMAILALGWCLMWVSRDPSE